MDPSPSSFLLSFTHIFQPIDFELGLSIFCVLILVVLSALLSGSEVAMFSISNKQRFDLEDQNKNANKRVLTLLKEPKKLLATILIANNFINVCNSIGRGFHIIERQNSNGNILPKHSSVNKFLEHHAIRTPQ